MTDSAPFDRGPTDSPASHLATPYRTHTCGALRVGDDGTTARLSGWVNRRRDQGGLIFLDLRDRHGVTQVVIDRADAPDAHDVASRVRSEFVITVERTVARRIPGTENAEVETPNLIKSTPEGARDFIVPSRLQPGSVYALPQSPQQLKQLLMVAGIDRYFQIARCFRDEDLRGDRQPEFTQLDLEMSFVDEDTVMAFVEEMVIAVCRATTPDRPIQEEPFPRITYDEAMERFGSDKPDLRFGMELVDLAPLWSETPSGFRVFDETLTRDGRVKAIVAPGMGGSSRKE